MRKCNTFLCLVTTVFFMTACGRNHIQAQTPVSVTEFSAEGSTSQSSSHVRAENVNETSKDRNPMETETEVSEASEMETETEVSEASEMETETEVSEADGMETKTRDDMEESAVMNMNVQVGDAVFSAVLEKNEAVDALVEMMRENPVVIQMSDYAGFEKVGPLGTSLPASDSQTTTHAGDIVLYNENQIVIFYGSNSWSYTRLGHITDLTGWEEALGSKDVTVSFSLP